MAVFSIQLLFRPIFCSKNSHLKKIKLYAGWRLFCEDAVQSLDFFSGVGGLQFGIGNHFTFEGVTGYKIIAFFSPDDFFNF